VTGTTHGRVKAKASLLALLLVGCHAGETASSDVEPDGSLGDGQNVDGGVDLDGGVDVDGGTDAGFDGGLDGGTDGGSDGGLTCTNTVEQVPLECRFHIPEDQTPTYANNPPVSGMHYPVWARWQKYTDVIPRGYWVHNLEHGGVVFLYRPDAPQSIKDALERVYDAIPLEQDCVDLGFPHNRCILTPDPLLDVPWAVTVSGPESEYCVGFGYRIKSDCIADEQALVDFALQYRNHSAESFCDEGFYPYLP
jgi:hypothetical protein